MDKNFSIPKVILFDWDNTLVDTWPIIYDSLSQTFMDMGRKPWTLDEVKERVAKSMRDSFPVIFPDDYEKAMELYQKYFRSMHLKRLKSLEGSIETLQTIKNLGIKTGLVSNKRGDNLRTEVNHIKWSGYFDTVVGAGDAQKDKPHKEPVLMALNEVNESANEDVWFVGDSIVDIECAHNSGVKPVLYDNELDSNKRFKGYDVAYHFRSHKDLHRFMNDHFVFA